jgi:hypothetical protein
MKKFLLLLVLVLVSVPVFAAPTLSSTDTPLINTIRGIIYVFQIIGGLYCLFQIIEGAMKMSGNGEEGKRHLMNAGVALLIVVMLFPIANMIIGKAKTEGKASTGNIENVLK